jgi:hypothetical protein
LGEEETAKELFEQAAAKIHIQTRESEGDLRTILSRDAIGHAMASRLRLYRLNPKKKKAFDEPVASRKPHMVAASGNLEELKMVAAEDPESARR